MDQHIPEDVWKGRTARPVQLPEATREGRGPASCAPSSHADTSRHQAKAKIWSEGRARNRPQNERKKSWKSPAWPSSLLAVWSEMEVAVSKRMVATCHLKQAAAPGGHIGCSRDEGNQTEKWDSQKRRNLVRDPLSGSMGEEGQNWELDTSHHSGLIFGQRP